MQNNVYQEEKMIKNTQTFTDETNKEFKPKQL